MKTLKKKSFSITRIIMAEFLMLVVVLGFLFIDTMNKNIEEAQNYVTDLTNKQPNLNYTSEYGIITKTGVASDDLRLADNFVEGMPQNVQDYVLSHDIAIIIVPDYESLDSLSNEYGTKNSNDFRANDSNVHVTGITQPHFNKPVIHIYADEIGSSFIHELGHAIDYTVNGNQFMKQSNSISFNKIYKEEKNDWVPLCENVGGYDASTVEEYFAESFQQYILYPEYLQENAPLTYEYMEQFVTTL